MWRNHHLSCRKSWEWCWSKSRSQRENQDMIILCKDKLLAHFPVNWHSHKEFTICHIPGKYHEHAWFSVTMLVYWTVFQYFRNRCMAHGLMQKHLGLCQVNWIKLFPWIHFPSVVVGSSHIQKKQIKHTHNYTQLPTKTGRISGDIYDHAGIPQGCVFRSPSDGTKQPLQQWLDFQHLRHALDQTTTLQKTKTTPFLLFKRWSFVDVSLPKWQKNTL